MACTIAGRFSANLKCVGQLLLSVALCGGGLVFALCPQRQQERPVDFSRALVTPCLLLIRECGCFSGICRKLELGFTPPS